MATETIVDEPTTVNGLTLRPSVRKRWVEALRSGEYKQGRGSLCNGEKYCCLGVLCETSGLEYDGSDDFPSPGILRWASGDDLERFHAESVDRFLVTLNDSERYTFAQIADIIEGVSE